MSCEYLSRLSSLPPGPEGSAGLYSGLRISALQQSRLDFLLPIPIMCPPDLADPLITHQQFPVTISAAGCVEVCRKAA